MNKELIKRKQLDWWRILIMMSGCIQPIYYTKSEYYAGYMRFWHPLSWVLILIFVIFCVFNDYTIGEFISKARRPKDTEWKKVSIWKTH